MPPRSKYVVLELFTAGFSARKHPILAYKVNDMPTEYIGWLCEGASDYYPTDFVAETLETSVLAQKDSMTAAGRECLPRDDFLTDVTSTAPNIASGMLFELLTACANNTRHVNLVCHNYYKFFKAFLHTLLKSSQFDADAVLAAVDTKIYDTAFPYIAATSGARIKNTVSREEFMQNCLDWRPQVKTNINAVAEYLGIEVPSTGDIMATQAQLTDAVYQNYVGLVHGDAICQRATLKEVLSSAR